MKCPNCGLETILFDAILERELVLARLEIARQAKDNWSKGYDFFVDLVEQLERAAKQVPDAASK